MLIGLTRSLEVGKNVTLELEFADGERLSFEAPVQMVSKEHDHSTHDH
jgi:copper(I)-binding protein